MQESDLPEFCHPKDGHVFNQPFLCGKDIAVSLGHLTLKIYTALPAKRNDKAVKHISRLPWKTFDTIDRNNKKDNWTALDNHRGGLWPARKDQLPLWHPSSVGKQNVIPRMNTEKFVFIGPEQIAIPHALLQLISKLHAVEFFFGRLNKGSRYDQTQGGGHLYLRFKHGIGIALGSHWDIRRIQLNELVAPTGYAILSDPAHGQRMAPPNH